MFATINLSTIDIVTFVSYFVAVICLGLWLSARSKASKAEDYFLAGKKLPWYAIGGSLIIAMVSTEHLVGLIGWSYTYGFVLANFEWGAWYTWSIGLFFFLPFYYRTKIYTVPEFMSKRYNNVVRYILSITTIIAYVSAFEGGVMYAGSKILNAIFGMPLPIGVLILGLATGIYAIAGGFLAVIWVDFLQFILFVLGGILVLILGLIKVGGIGELVSSSPEKFYMYYTVHDKCPIIAFYICGLFVGAYYIASNQFVVQRCLSARSQWDGRMGLLSSNFVKIFMPLITIVPGIIAFKLFPGLKDPDQAYPILINALVYKGIAGIILAGLAAAIMSTIASGLSSAAMLVTMDLYIPLRKKRPSEEHLVKVGRLLTGLLLVIGIFLGLFYTSLIDPVTGQPKPVFSLIMTIFFTIGPPISIVLLLGIFWKRATSAAAVSTLVAGYFISLLSKSLIFTPYEALSENMRSLLSLGGFKIWIDNLWLVRNYNNFLGEAIWSGLVSLVIMVTVSFFTKPKPYEEIKNLLWRPSMLSEKILDVNGKDRRRHLIFWWLVCMCLTGLGYAVFAWFQITH